MRQRRVDAPLRRVRVAAHRVHLRDHRHVRAVLLRSQRRAHPGQPRANNQYVMLEQFSETHAHTQHTNLPQLSKAHAAIQYIELPRQPQTPVVKSRTIRGPEYSKAPPTPTTSPTPKLSFRASKASRETYDLPPSITPRLSQTSPQSLVISSAAEKSRASRPPPRHASPLTTTACEPLYAHSNDKSLHSGFIHSTSAIFFSRRHRLICFSRAIADRTSDVTS